MIPQAARTKAAPVQLPRPEAPILVVGVPRSGTTWLGEVLARAPGLRPIHEPDNETHQPWALRAKRSLGRFPVLAPWDVPPRDYQLLWERALTGRVPRRGARWIASRGLLHTAGREELRAAFDTDERHFSLRLRLAGRLADADWQAPGGRRPLVKSVHAVMALDWLNWTFQPAMVVILRNPLNIAASYLELGWLDAGLHENEIVLARYLAPWVPTLPARVTSVARVAWQIGLLSSTLRLAIQSHPEWAVASHEDLCRAPGPGFQRLFEELGLTWTVAAEDFLTAADRAGSGMVTNRVSAEQPERWRRRLSRAQAAEIQSVLADFPLPSLTPLRSSAVAAGGF